MKGVDSSLDLNNKYITIPVMGAIIAGNSR